MSSDDRPGFELPLRLLLGFRVLIDDLHAELARRGHPDLRPMHGFVLQAIGPGTTAADLGRALGVSKQAAGKTLDGLAKLGSSSRSTSPPASSTSCAPAGPRPSARSASEPSRTTCAR